MSDLVERYNQRVEREAALFEEKCKRTAYAMARRMVKKQIQEQYELNEEEAEEIIDSKVSLIKKYANRLLTKIRQQQMPRHKTFHTGSKIENLGQEEREEINEHINNLFTEKFAPSTGMSAGEEQKAHTLKGDNLPQDPSQKRTVTLQAPQMNTKPQVVFNPPDRRVDNPKIQNALGKKADQSNTPDVILREVFVRGLNAWTEETGVSPEQYGFARVNSFINKGKAYRELDADLVGLDESLLAGALAAGTIAGAGALGGMAARALKGAKMRLSGEAGRAVDAHNKHLEDLYKKKKNKANKAEPEEEEEDEEEKDNASSQPTKPKQAKATPGTSNTVDSGEEEDKPEKDTVGKYTTRKLGTYRSAAVDGALKIFKQKAYHAGPGQAPGSAIASFGPPSGMTR